MKIKMLNITTSKTLSFWLVAIPCIIFGTASFFLPMSPFAFAKVLNKQYEIEQHKKALEKGLKELSHSPDSIDHNERMRIVTEKIEEANHALLLYKRDWKDSFLSIIANSSYNTFKCGNALIPFCFIMYFVVFFLAIALTAHHTIPFFIRMISFITGNMFAVITCMQWIVAGFTVPSWYTRITALILIPLALGALFFCWQRFLQQHMWKRN
jgi:hypothetical protein